MSLKFQPIALYNACMEIEMTPNELGKRAGIDMKRLHRIFSGFDSPTVEELARLSSALDVSVARLYGKEGNVVPLPLNTSQGVDRDTLGVVLPFKRVGVSRVH